MNNNGLKNYKNLTLSELYKLNLHPTNRDINQQHVNELKKVIMDEGLDKLPPLQVGLWTNNTLDGQGRREATLQLAREGKIDPHTTMTVQYVDVAPEDEEAYIIKINGGKGTKPWVLKDYISSKIKGGNSNVVLFDKWRREKLGEKGSIRIAMSILKGYNCTKLIKNGDFTLTKDEINTGDNVLDEMKHIFSLFKVIPNSNNIEAFASAWRGIRNEHSFKDWMKVFKNRTNKTKYIRNLDKVSTRREAWENVFNDAHRALEMKVAV